MVFAVGVPNCNGFVSTVGLFGVNVNVLCVVAVVFVFVFVFVFAVLILPNNGVAPAVVEAVDAAPNDNNGALFDVGFPNWKALVSRKINQKYSFLVNFSKTKRLKLKPK